jgi:magnesium chelatase subunit D
VPGIGDGARAGGRAPATAGAAITATDDPESGHGLHLFATVLAAAGRVDVRPVAPAAR